MNSRKCIGYLLGLTLVSLLASGSVFAKLWPFHNTSAEKTEYFTLGVPAKIANNQMLPAGDYKIEIPLNTNRPDVAFTFTQNGNVIAHAKAKVVTENEKNNQTEVMLDQRGGENVVTQIRPGGLAESLVFSGAGRTAKSNQ